MKLNCKRIDFTYIPGEEIFNFPEESGLPFLFDVDENDSEIETVARECIAATVAYILEWFGIPIDTEEAIRERDW